MNLFCCFLTERLPEIIFASTSRLVLPASSFIELLLTLRSFLIDFSNCYWSELEFEMFRPEILSLLLLCLLLSSWLITVMDLWSWVKDYLLRWSVVRMETRSCFDIFSRELFM